MHRWYSEKVGAVALLVCNILPAEGGTSLEILS